MTINGQQISLKKQIAILVGVLTFGSVVFDALNGFAGFLAVQPFATKRYVTDVVIEQIAHAEEASTAQFKETASTNADVQGRLVNLQLMVLELSITQLEGQISARSGEMIEVTVHLKELPNDLLLQRRKAELADVIERLNAREKILQCYLDNLRGLKRDCR